MLKIPESLETMRPETAKVVERLYAPLLKQLDLAPEQSEKFLQILLDQKMDGLAQKTDLLRHSDPARMSRQVAEVQRETDARLQALLGDASYSRYQEYQAGIGDRGALVMWKNDFTQHPLTEEQQELLLTAMAAARKTPGAPMGGGNAGFSIADSSEVMKQKLERQEAMDQHVLQQAAGFLSPGQLEILSSTQAKWRAARKTGYAMAQEMYGVRGGPETGPVLK